MVRSSLFLYATIAINILASDAFAHICDVCECQPSRLDVFSISCGCESTKYLQLTSSMMLGLQSTSMVIIKNCETVSVERNSFFQLTKLDTLGIQNCSRLYLATGAFANLNSLLINGVKEISFGEMAFMGARGIKNLNIRSSNITELPIYSFFDVTGMESFSLRGVNIGNIQKHAFNVSANTVTIDNSMINHVESEGFTLRAQKVIIKNSEIVTSAPGPIKISTEYQTRLLENRFKNLFQINITSPFAEFYKNTFDLFDPRFLANIQMPRVMSNIFTSTVFEGLFEGFNPKDFYDNHFTCKCHMDLFNYTQNSVNYEILRKNFCIANCTVSLYEFEADSVTACFRDNRANASRFCKNSRSAKSFPDVFVSSTTAKEEKNITFIIEPRFGGSDEGNGSNIFSGGEPFAVQKLIYLLIVSACLLKCL